MKQISKGETFEFLGNHYRVTRHCGAEIIELETLEQGFWGKWKWKKVYMGHRQVLEEALKIFNS